MAGMGIWCCIKLKGNNVIVRRIFCAYQTSGKYLKYSGGIGTVYAQQKRYYISIEGKRCPIEIFREKIMK